MLVKITIFLYKNHEKKEIIEIGLIAAEGITAIIPALGGVLTSVWSDIEDFQAKRKQERLEEFYLSLKDEVEKIKEQINFSYVSLIFLTSLN